MNVSLNRTPPGSSDRLGRTLGIAQISSAAILVISQLTELNNGALQSAAYVFFATELVLAVAAEITGRRHGRGSELYLALWWLVGVAFDLGVTALIVDSVRDGHRPYFLIAILLANVLLTLTGPGHGGRRAAARLIGEKSRLLLAKLQPARPAMVPARIQHNPQWDSMN